MEPLFKITDETFSEKQAGNYQLFVRYGLNSFSYCVLDSLRNKFIYLKVFDLGKNESFDFSSGRLKFISGKEEVLQYPFKSVSISMVNQSSTLVPAAFYDEKQKERFLNFNHAPLRGDKICSDYIRAIDTWNIFSVPETAIRELNGIFRNFTIHHYSSSLLLPVLSKYKNITEKKFIVHVQQSSLEIILTESGNLLFYNSFLYRSPEDFMYFLMFSCDRLKLNPENISIILLGEIERNSVIYSLMNKYFRNPEFGERNESYSYCYGFSDFPGQYFYNLLNQPSCV